MSDVQNRIVPGMPRVSEEVARYKSIDSATKPGETGFLEEFSRMYKMDEEDEADLHKHIDMESFKRAQEHWNRLVSFMLKTKMPRLIVFATLATNGSMTMVEIAKLCGVSKQAIHKEFRRMEPEFERHAKGFKRIRNFKNQENQNDQIECHKEE